MEIQTTRVTSGFFDRKVRYFKKSLEKVGDFEKSPLKNFKMTRS